MIDPKQIPDESWRKIQQLLDQPEYMCRLIVAAALNAWPRASHVAAGLISPETLILPLPKEGE